MTRWIIKAFIVLILVEGLIVADRCLRAYGEETPWIDPHQYWTTLRDGTIDVCADGIDYEWVKTTLQGGWQIRTKRQCEDPDLIVTVHELPDWEGHKVCGMADWGDPCHVSLNTYCFEHREDFLVDRVPEKALLHEVGHCAGFNHKDTGVMFYMTSNWTDEEDVRALHERYGLTTGLVPEPTPGGWTMSRWTGPAPTTADALGVAAAYIFSNGSWLRYIEGAPEGVNTIGTIQPDQPILVLAES